jgi:hypothetical protein
MRQRLLGDAQLLGQLLLRQAVVLAGLGDTRAARPLVRFGRPICASTSIHPHFINLCTKHSGRACWNVG